MKSIDMKNMWEQEEGYLLPKWILKFAEKYDTVCVGFIKNI